MISIPIWVFVILVLLSSVLLLDALVVVIFSIIYAKDDTLIENEED